MTVTKSEEEQKEEAAAGAGCERRELARRRGLASGDSRRVREAKAGVGAAKDNLLIVRQCK